MTVIRWTTPAIDELEAHIKHIRENNAEAALAVARTILDRIDQLENFPNLGRPGKIKDTRELVSGPYVISYWLLPGDIAEILHVWHGAQDWQ